MNAVRPATPGSIVAPHGPSPEEATAEIAELDKERARIQQSIKTEKDPASKRTLESKAITSALGSIASAVSRYWRIVRM